MYLYIILKRISHIYPTLGFGLAVLWHLRDQIDTDCTNTVRMDSCMVSEKPNGLSLHKDISYLDIIRKHFLALPGFLREFIFITCKWKWECCSHWFGTDGQMCAVSDTKWIHCTSISYLDIITKYCFALSAFYFKE